MSDAGQPRALVTIGGSPNGPNGGNLKISAEKSVEVFTLTSKVSQNSKLSTSSRGDNSLDATRNEHSKPEFRV